MVVQVVANVRPEFLLAFGAFISINVAQFGKLYAWEIGAPDLTGLA